MKNNFRGITLIALVITIIVLLILAGVSIAMLTGQNGILSQASKAAEETEVASAIEQAKIDVLNWQNEQLKKGLSADITKESLKNILQGKEYVGTVGDSSFTTAKNGYTVYFDEIDSELIKYGEANETLREYFSGENGFDGDFYNYITTYVNYLQEILSGDEWNFEGRYNELYNTYGDENSHIGTLSLLVSDFLYSKNNMVAFPDKITDENVDNNISALLSIPADEFQEFCSEKIKELDSPAKEARYAKELLEKGAIPNENLTLLDLYILDNL